ncbi:hypothetical protein CC86DRAFT_382728 [Ophiobolus disseminans]|uniref:Uncharacterized protein n=1 Tax=Ophiobolus disseminans TaxID=1469910 RepID=A0A6A6ZZH3_9PLEO|nr:hypothetical protein CC86DRAFT_382728 [Ophiobolus disseminans]
MNYRIVLIVLARYFANIEFFVHMQKLSKPSRSPLKILHRFVRDPVRDNEAYMIFLAKRRRKRLVRVASCNKRFYVDLIKRDDVFEAVLYLEDGNRRSGCARGSNHLEALKNLPGKTKNKIDESQIASEDEVSRRTLASSPVCASQGGVRLGSDPVA